MLRVHSILPGETHPAHATRHALKSEKGHNSTPYEVVAMRSCIRLYGPRISEGLVALEKMVEESREDASLGRIMTRMDPTMDLMTEQMMADGEEVLGEYDFVRVAHFPS